MSTATATECPWRGWTWRFSRDGAEIDRRAFDSVSDADLHALLIHADALRPVQAPQPTP